MSEKSLFGTSGIRGSANDLFTNQFSFDLGRTFSQFLSSHGESGNVAVGRDPRDSSPRIKSAFVSGLITEKIKVFDEGIVPVPAVHSVLISDDFFSGSVMVTGSHIKSDLNGIKFFAFKEEISKEAEREIEKIYFELKEKVEYRKLDADINSENRALEIYTKYLLSHADGPYPKWKVVVDPGNGAQTPIAPGVFANLGLNVIPLNCDITQGIICRDTEVESDFEDLKKKVVETVSDFGIGFDSDGDRVIFIDSVGNYISGDYVGTLIAKALPDTSVATPISTSQVIDNIGKNVIRTKVGSPFVVAAIKDNKISFGFEANGGGIFTEMKSRDGGRSAIEILNLLKRKNKSLSDLVLELPKFYLFKEKIEYKWELKDKILTEVKRVFRGQKVEELDGIKIWVNDDSWILFRSSSNAPEFRVFSESASEKTASKLLEDGLSLVRSQVN